MKATIKFTEDSPYYEAGEKERVVKNLTEVHYNYKTPLQPSTAFESDIDSTGFTIQNKHIDEFEVFIEDNELKPSNKHVFTKPRT